MRPIVNIHITLVKQSLSPLGDLIYQILRFSASQSVYATKQNFKRSHILNATTIRSLCDVSMSWKARKGLIPNQIAAQDRKLLRGPVNEAKSPC